MTGTLLTPRTLAEAVAARRMNPRARPIAGGTDVVAEMNRGAPVTGFISLRELPELRGMRHGDGQWRLGSMSTIAEIRANLDLAPAGSALGQACRSLGSRQVRNRATVGGNICGGGPQRTLIPVLLAYDAVVEVVGVQGRRRVPLSEVLEPGAPASPGTKSSPPCASHPPPGHNGTTGSGPATPCAGPPPRSPLWWTNRPTRSASRSAAWRPQPCGRPSPRPSVATGSTGGEDESTTTWPRRSARRPRRPPRRYPTWQPVPDTGVTPLR